ncbi:PREDICTED: conserved, partial [Prunus dulcis]
FESCRKLPPLHPIINKTSPCLNAVDWSSGNICNKTVANGIAEPELICQKNYSPNIGKAFRKIIPHFSSKETSKLA